MTNPVLERGRMDVLTHTPCLCYAPLLLIKLPVQTRIMEVRDKSRGQPTSFKENIMGKGIRLVVLAALALIMLLGGTASAQQKTLVNGIDFGFPPFGFGDAQGNPAGFDVDSVNWIAGKMGFSVRHQHMDWDGIVLALNAGKIDFIASGMSIAEEWKKVVNFTIPYHEVTQVLVVNEGEAVSFADMFTRAKRSASSGAQTPIPCSLNWAKLKKKWDIE